MPHALTLCFVADVSNIHVQRWLRFFVARGHRVFCLSDKPGALEGVTVVELPNRDTLLGKNSRQVSKTAVLKARARCIQQAVRELRPDILHAIFLYQRGWSAALSGFHPLVVTLLGSDVYLPEKHYRHPFQLFRDHLFNSLALRQADLITAVSDDLCTAANRMTMGSVPVELIPIGTDPKLFQPGLETDALRRRLEIPQGSFVVLSPRQITPHYNQDSILQAVPRVLSEVPNAIFLMKDTFCDTEERQAFVAKLKQKADTLGIAHAVRWADQVPFEELPLFYNLADVVVSVPTTDGMPVTIFEAMACNKPIIAGDLSSYNEVITHGLTGLRVPVRNSQALAQAIIKLHQHPELVKHLVEESQVVLQQYGLFTEQMLRMERYYQAITEKRLSCRSTLRKQVNRLFYRALVGAT